MTIKITINKSLRIALIVTLVATLLSFGKLNHCRSAGWGSPDVYIHMCYSDISALYGAREVNTDKWPYASQDNSVEYPVLTGIVMWATGLLIDEVQKELDESNVTGNVDGYQTPFAFSGKNGKEKRKKTATQLGYSIVDNDVENIDESELKGYLAADVVDDIVKSIGSKFVSGQIKNAPNKNYIYLKLTDVKFGSGVVKMLKLLSYSF